MWLFGKISALEITISSEPVIIVVKLRSFAEQSPSKSFQIYRSIRSRKTLTKAKNKMYIKITLKVLRKSAIANKNKSIK